MRIAAGLSSVRRVPLRRRQRGIVLLMYMIGLLAVMGMAGFALDLGLAYLTKSRLQNAVDAAALAGAKALYLYESTSIATTTATTVYGANATNISGGSLAVTFSPTAVPFSASALNPRYVRVAVTGLPVSMYLSQLFGVEAAQGIGASAVAGPMPMAASCGAPLGICAADPASGDHECDDANGCFGLGSAELSAHEEPIAGNYGLLDLGSGAASVGRALAGAEDMCLNDGTTQNTQPGAANTIINALNSRFGTANGVYNDPSTYPPDKVTLGPLLYPAYEAALASGVYDHPGGTAKRRTMLVPVLDCSQPMAGASKPVTVLGKACMFLTREVPASGPTSGTVYMQIINECMATGGVPDPDSDSGAVEIRLFS